MPQPIGQRIRTDRKGIELTQAALGNEVGLANTTIARIERGEKLPSLKALGRIARVLGWSAQELGEIVWLVSDE